MTDNPNENASAVPKKPSIWSKEEDDILIVKAKDFGIRTGPLLLLSFQDEVPSNAVRGTKGFSQG